MQGATAYLTPWANFYIMAGSSAAALTGLMFVVITLVAGNGGIRRTTTNGISTFSTPTVVHFCAALFVSATLSVPWRLLIHPALLLAAAGVYGMVYVLRLMVRTRQLETYRADVEDWAWYTIIPFAAYAAIFGGAVWLTMQPVEALFALAAGALLLIFLGIRNAWDVVTFIAIYPDELPPQNQRDSAKESPAP